MMFFTYSQNNSGGYFVNDEENGVCEYVIIEADTPSEADSKLNAIGDNTDGFYDYCHCCGERWSTGWTDESDADEFPSICGDPISKVKKGSFCKRCFTHYKDGRIEQTVFNA